MPISGIHHVDLAVRELERSLAFYKAVFEPLGATEAFRYSTYRGSEPVVYLRLGRQYLGLRRADGGEHRYYDVGMEHLPGDACVAWNSGETPPPISPG